MLRVALVTVMVLLTTACQQFNVNTQHDPYVDFKDYRSFSWMDEEKVPEEAELTRKQLQYLIEQELLAKGFVKVEINPDFVISYYGSKERKSTEQVVEYADLWGDRDRYRYYRHRDVDEDHKERRRIPPVDRERVSYTRRIEKRMVTYTESTLIVDFLNASSKEIVWQANIHGVLNEQNPMAGMPEAIKKALMAFPPQ